MKKNIITLMAAIVIAVSSVTTPAHAYISYNPAYTAPQVAQWYQGRVNANLRTAHRERTVGDAITKTVTGISRRDIKENGILGGNNSDARKVCNSFAGLFGGSC